MALPSLFGWNSVPSEAVQLKPIGHSSFGGGSVLGWAFSIPFLCLIRTIKGCAHLGACVCLSPALCVHSGDRGSSVHAFVCVHVHVCVHVRETETEREIR